MKTTQERVQKLLKFFNKYNATKSVLDKSEHQDISHLLKNNGSKLAEKAFAVGASGAFATIMFSFIFDSLIPFAAFWALMIFNICVVFFDTRNYKEKTDAFFMTHFAKSKFVKHSMFRKLFTSSEIEKTKDARLKFFHYVLNNCTPEDQQQIYVTCTKLSHRHNTFFWEHSLNILNKNAIKWSEIEKMFSREKSVAPSATVMVDSEDLKMNSDDEKYLGFSNNLDNEPAVLDSENMLTHNARKDFADVSEKENSGSIF